MSSSPSGSREARSFLDLAELSRALGARFPKSGNVVIPALECHTWHFPPPDWLRRGVDSSLPLAPSIDWLTVTQLVAYPLPDFGSGRMVRLTMDGAVQYSVVTTETVKGSHSSSADMRIVGGRVFLSFNPSRWGQPHNVDGVTSMPEAFAVASDLVRQHVPEFLGFDSSATLSRVDVCQTFAAGDLSSGFEFLRSASLCRQYRARSRVRVSEDGCTVYWGTRSSGSRLCKLYLKGPEVRARRGPVELAAFLESCGAVRHEVLLGRNYLRAHGLRSPSAWSVAAMHDQLQAFKPFSASLPESRPFSDAREVLLAAGFKPQALQLRLSALQEWLAGHRPLQGLSVRSRYRVRKDLKRLFNVDIFATNNVSPMPFRPRAAITLSALVLPAEFRRRA